MPATSSTCSVEVEGEWKKEDGEKMLDWGFPPSVVMENEEEVSDQGQSESNENHESHVNYAYFGVGHLFSKIY